MDSIQRVVYKQEFKTKTKEIMSKFSKYLLGFNATPKKPKEVKEVKSTPTKKRTPKVYACPREAKAREKNRLRCLAYYHKNKQNKKDDETD